ncbi:PDZ domain-containing protein [candidate division KSB1 bacterium]|nr:PDZ domain-containing protein [candidate division KSB1 bacterium]
MKEKIVDKSIFILISVFFLALGVIGYFRSSNLPGGEFEYAHTTNGLEVTRVIRDSVAEQCGVQSKDTLLALDGISFNHKWELDFLIDCHAVGNTVDLSVKRGSNLQHIRLIIGKRYRSKERLILYCLLCLGILFWIIGMYVYQSKPVDWSARIFYSMCMTVVVSIMTIWPGCPKGGDIGGYIFVSLFWFFFALMPAFVLYFSILYPQKKRILQRNEHLPLLVFRPAVVFILLLIGSYLTATITKNLKFYHYFYWIYNYGFRSYYMLYLLISIGSAIHSYIVASSKDDRNKIQWILWGISIGMFPFIFLWTIPQLFNYEPLIPDVVNYLFIFIIPISLAFSIVKYKALDIEFIIRRSIVYLVATILLIVLFVLVIDFTRLDFQIVLTRYRWHLILGSGILVLGFSPFIARHVTNLIKSLFSKDYDFRQTIQSFGKILTTTNEADKIPGVLLNEIDKVIPNKNIILLLENESRTKFNACASLGTSLTDTRNLHLSVTSAIVRTADENRVPLVKHVKFSSVKKRFRDSTNSKRYFKIINYKLLLLPQYITKLTWEFIFYQPGKRIIQLPHTTELDKIGIELIIPVILQDRLAGFLLFGEKVSKVKYSEEDMALISQMSINAFMAMEHLRLQESMILERTEKKRLEELNQLKSEFISQVSHELRTPLTSICWSVENLLDGIPEKLSPKVTDYLTGVHESSQHLTRMIENLLDLSRIEAGKIEQCVDCLKLADLIRKVLSVLESVATKKNITFQYESIDELWVNADPDHLQMILTNLVENAIKYTHEGDTIQVTTKLMPENGSHAENKNGSRMIAISVIDHGEGIAIEKQHIIFDRFERIKKNNIAPQKGLGLGLHIVKQLVELQHGSIWVASELGKGSMFTFTLPAAKIE